MLYKRIHIVKWTIMVIAIQIFYTRVEKMAGRGRGATLPAWMTAPGGPTMTSVSTESSSWTPSSSMAATTISTSELVTNMAPSSSIHTALPNAAAAALNISPPAPRGPPPLQTIQNNPLPLALPNNMSLNPPPFAAPPMFNPALQQPEHMMQNLQQPHGVPPQSMGGPSMMPQYSGMGHMPGMGHMAGMGQMPGMHGMMFPPPAGMPGMPAMSGMPGMPMTGRLPMALPHQQFQSGGQSSSSTNNSGTTLDPNNDVSCWSEHINEAEDRKYWYNKVTLVSTYEKPFWYTQIGVKFLWLL